MKAHYKIYVINLDRSKDRLEKMKIQFRELGLSFERVAAVDGSKLDEAQYHSENTFYKALQPNEMACYLSHVKCWHRILEDGVEHGIILEDDVAVDEHFASIIKKLSNESEKRDLDFVKFSHNKIHRKKATGHVPLTDNNHLTKLSPLPVGTLGQWVSNKAARELTAHHAIPKQPIDVFLRNEWLFSFTIYNVFPNIVRTAPGTVSTIAQDRTRSSSIQGIKKPFGS